MDATELQHLIREVPDFPRPGINFYDITTLLRNPAGLRGAVELMAATCSGVPVDGVAGVESRGFILGAPLALALGCGFIPVRKPGKLPAAVVREEYALEYGTDALEIHRDAAAPGQRVLVVDDLLATGGTLAATCRLLDTLGATVAGVVVLVELTFLDGRSQLAGRRVESVLRY